MLRACNFSVFIYFIAIEWSRAKSRNAILAKSSFKPILEQEIVKVNWPEMSPVQLTLIRCKVSLGYRRNTRILSTPPWVTSPFPLSQEMFPPRIILSSTMQILYDGSCRSAEETANAKRTSTPMQRNHDS